MSEVAAPGSAAHPDLPSFFELVALESVDSTNSEVTRRADQGAREGLLVWARRQTDGRGRQGRQWESPDGNLFCSLLLMPEVEPVAATELGFVTGVAVRECVDGLVPPGRDVSCKWPNDVLVEGRKIAGVPSRSSCAKTIDPCRRRRRDQSRQPPRKNALSFKRSADRRCWSGRSRIRSCATRERPA